jgi:hypothetical protein
MNPLSFAEGDIFKTNAKIIAFLHQQGYDFKTIPSLTWFEINQLIEGIKILNDTKKKN